MKTKKNNQTDGKIAVLFVFTLLRKIYKNPKDVVPFIQEMEKYIDNKTYISDKVWEFPGKDLESEAKLRSVFQVIFERRI